MALLFANNIINVLISLVILVVVIIINKVCWRFTASKKAVV